MHAQDFFIMIHRHRGDFTIRELDSTLKSKRGSEVYLIQSGKKMGACSGRRVFRYSTACTARRSNLILMDDVVSSRARTSEIQKFELEPVLWLVKFVCDDCLS